MDLRASTVSLRTRNTALVGALQSAWNRTQRIIYGCPLPVLALLRTQSHEGQHST
jgi:hypothetical protein